ncbi:hypothetical protein ACLOJK_024202 [Asimina triloba]
MVADGKRRGRCCLVVLTLSPRGHDADGWSACWQQLDGDAETSGGRGVEDGCCGLLVSAGMGDGFVDLGSLAGFGQKRLDACVELLDLGCCPLWREAGSGCSAGGR